MSAAAGPGGGGASVPTPSAPENPALLLHVSALPPGAYFSHRAADGSFWFFRCVRADSGAPFFRAERWTNGAAVEAQDFRTAARAVRFVLDTTARRAALVRGTVRHRERSHPDSLAERAACEICRAEATIRHGIERARSKHR